jgi:prefoldin subunit 5
MATKKTTESTPKVRILTDEQLQTLKDLSTDLRNIRRTLENLEGEDNPSTIMFKVGAMYNVADKAETMIDELVDQFEEECDECGDDY